MSTSILAMQAVPMALIARQLGHSDTRMNRAPLCASRAELRGGHYPGELQHEDLRALLQRSEMADLFDSAACQRIGKLISRAVFNPAKPGW